MIQFGNYQYLVYICLTAGLVLFLYALYLYWKRRILGRVFASPRIRQMVMMGDRRIMVGKSAAIIVAIVLCALVLLKPRWGTTVREVKNEGVDMLIALDVSLSMLAQDVPPSRLKRAKDAVRILVESLKGDRAGLVLFAGDSFLQCPLTNDLEAFTLFLDAAGPDSVNLQGTNIGQMIKEAERVFAKRRMTSRLLVVVTDGEDHEGQVPAAIETFKKLDVKVFTIGIGRDAGEPIPAGENDPGGDVYFKDRQGKPVRTKKNPDLLREIARQTGGEYIDISGDFSGMRTLIETLTNLTKNEYGSRIVKERQEQYQVFLCILIIVLSLEFFIPERRNIS